MTDRSLPNLMPTTDRTLFDRTVEQSVAIDRPPPSQQHHGRATTFDALAPVVSSNFFSGGVQRRLLVVFTDGESAKMSPLLRLELQRRVAPVFVHVWADGERIYGKNGKPDPNYLADPESTIDLEKLAQIANGQAVSEHQFEQLLRDAHNAVGDAQTHTFSAGYARVPLAPWFVLAALAPLMFLLWRRNA
jgi:hypothetical protein